MNDYQQFVKDCASPQYDDKLSIIGLVGEVGELADAVKKSHIYKDMPINIKDKILDEAGDVLWQLVNVLNQFDINLEDVISYNIAKLESRHGGKETATDGGKR